LSEQGEVEGQRKEVNVGDYANAVALGRHLQVEWKLKERK
jgi:hypothetical protein